MIEIKITFYAYDFDMCMYIMYRNFKTKLIKFYNVSRCFSIRIINIIIILIIIFK